MRKHGRRGQRRRLPVTVSDLWPVFGGGAAVIVAALAVLCSTAQAMPLRSSTVIDQTFSCAAELQHYPSLHALDIVASTAVTGKPAYVSLYTAVKKVDNLFVAQLSFESIANSRKVDAVLCRRSSTTVPLRASGLTSNGTATPQFRGGFFYRCPTAPRVLVRTRIVLTSGVPVSAQVAIRNANAKAAPIGYLTWTPTRLTEFLTNACVEIQTIP